MRLEFMQQPAAIHDGAWRIRAAIAVAGLALTGFGGLAHAKVSAEEAAALDTTLTPVGATRAGNADGTIPAWTPAAARGPLSGAYPSDPAIDAEKPLYVITGKNMAKYADKLSEGHQRLLHSYDNYEMAVYPSHRVVSFPDFIYASTKANATRCELVGTDSPHQCKQGFMFPVPKSGAEVIWNHKIRYRGDAARRFNNQMIVQPDGSAQMTKIVEEVRFFYASKSAPVPITGDGSLVMKYLSQTVAPPRLAGTVILVHERTSTGNEGRQAWLYSPSLKRIRRAPTVCCDNPYEGTDGMQFYDQVDMFNGTLERYDWKLLGKKEMIIPYDSNRIASPKVKYADMVRPHHLNQKLPRYELHRVWVVEANLRQGTNHVFHKRRFFVDEDSWYPAVVEDYDARGNLYELQEGHTIFAYNVQTVGGTPEVIYHFDSGKYFLTALANEDRPNDFSVKFDDGYFEQAAVMRRPLR